MQKKKGLLSNFTKRIIQAAVTISLIVWLLFRFDWAQGKVILLQTNWWPIGISLGSVIIVHILIVIRWGIILGKPSIRFSTLLRIYGTGLFSNNFLPTGIGGDGVRAALLRRFIPLKTAIFSIALDRIVGLITLVFLLLVFAIFGTASFLAPSMVSVIDWINGIIVFAVCIMGLSVVVYFISSKVRTRIQSWYGLFIDRWELPKWKIKDWVFKSLIGLFLSTLSQIFQAIAIWAIFYSLGTVIPFLAGFWIVILGGLSSVLPISINGIGVVEGVYVLVLENYQIDVTIILMGAFIKRIMAIIISILGGLFSISNDII